MAGKTATEAPDILAAFRPETCGPEDVERLIDSRIARIDAQISEHLQLAEELRAERKRWLSVTGGRSSSHPTEERT